MASPLWSGNRKDNLIYHFLLRFRILQKEVYTNEIWTYDSFPCRLDVRIIVALTPETAIPIKDLQKELSIVSVQLGMKSKRQVAKSLNFDEKSQ